MRRPGCWLRRWLNQPTSAAVYGGSKAERSVVIWKVHLELVVSFEGVIHVLGINQVHPLGEATEVERCERNLL